MSLLIIKVDILVLTILYHNFCQYVSFWTHISSCIRVHGVIVNCYQPMYLRPWLVWTDAPAPDSLYLGACCKCSSIVFQTNWSPWSMGDSFYQLQVFFKYLVTVAQLKIRTQLIQIGCHINMQMYCQTDYYHALIWRPWNDVHIKFHYIWLIVL